MESLITCPCCTKMYNLEAREPVYLSCCGDTACKDCFLNKMKEADGFKCLLCQSTEKVVLGINRSERMRVEKSLALKILMITCDIHKESRVEYYI